MAFYIGGRKTDYSIHGPINQSFLKVKSWIYFFQIHHESQFKYKNLKVLKSILKVIFKSSKMKFSDHAKKYGNIKGKGWINIYSNAIKRENFWVNIKELNGKQYTWKKMFETPLQAKEKFYYYIKITQ